MTKAKLHLNSEAKKRNLLKLNIFNRTICKWILFVVITMSFGKSYSQNKFTTPQKKNTSNSHKKSKSAKPKIATYNKTKPILEKIEIPQNDNSAAALKVVPRPKIPKGQLAIFKNGQYILITTKKVDNLEVSANCFATKKRTCTALEIGQTKVTSLVSPTGQVSNPASTLCDQLLGKNFIAIDSKGSEFDYCGFNDGTFVDTWTLLSKVMHK